MKVKLLVAYKDGDTTHKRRRIVEFQDEKRATDLCKQRMVRRATDEEVKAADEIPVIKASKKLVLKKTKKAKPAPKPDPKPTPEKDGE